MAATKALYNTKRTFGRAPQSKVANIVRNPGTFQRTNDAALYYQEQINEFSENLGKTLVSFGEENNVKSALLKVIEQLGVQIQEHEKHGQIGGGVVSFTLSVPLWVGKLLLAVLKAVAFAVTMFFGLVLAIASEGNASILPGIYNTFYGKNNKPKVENWNGGSTRKIRK